jgi:type II secretory pathway component PulJ
MTRSRSIADKVWALRASSKEGFTLVEILVAVAVLMILVVLVAQIVGSASSLTAAGHKRMDADDEARLVMDRIAADLSGMPRRSDLSLLLVNNRGNDELYFVSRSPGYAPLRSASNSGMTLVGYRVNTNGFQRVGKGLGWDDLAYSGTITNGIKDPDDYHTIAPSVLRVEYALLMKPGTINYDASETNKIGSNSLVNPSYLKTNCLGQAINNVAALQVVIAVLDQTSRKIVSPTSLEGLGGDGVFSDFYPLGADASASGVRFGQWIQNAPKAPAPKAAAGQIRIYQRHFPINR